MDQNQPTTPSPSDQTTPAPAPAPSAAAQTPTPVTVAAPPPESPKSNKKFIILAVIVLIAALLLGGAYYFVIAGISPAPSGSAPVVTKTPERSADNGTDKTITDPAPSPTEETKVYTAVKLEDLSLSGYTLTHPISWTAKEEKDEIMQTLTLSKDGYVLKINQAPTGGNFCVFEGELPDGPATDYRDEEVVEIDAAFGLLRRTTSGTSYSFCEQNAEDPNNFFLPTSIGFITYTVPANPDDKILAEMDAIITSIAKPE